MKKLWILVFIVLFSFGCSKEYYENRVEQSKLCIEGHVYYAIHSNGFSFAPKLNDDGTPCKCEKE